MQQLDYIGQPYVDRLRTTCVPPTPFYPEDPHHTKSARFLRKERLVAMFRMDEPMRAALAILGDTNAKEVVETMIINKAHPQWICTALLRQGIDVDVEALVRYKHYFFNTNLLDSSELKALMTARMSSDVSQDPDEARLNSLHAGVTKSDFRRSAAMSASPLASNIISTLRMGLMPTDMDVARVAGAARLAALAGNLDLSLRGLPTLAKDYALSAKLMTEILESVGDPSGDLQEGLQKLAIETDEDEVPYIHQLSEGSHTLDVAPVRADEVEASK